MFAIPAQAATRASKKSSAPATTAAPASLAKQQVTWAGVALRGRDVDAILDFPICSHKEIQQRFQNELTARLKRCQNPQFDLKIDDLMDYKSGSGLSLACVIESERAICQPREDYFFGQIAVGASLVVFDFRNQIIIQSIPFGTIVPIEKEKEDPHSEEYQTRVITEKMLLGEAGSTISLASQFEALASQMALQLKANFGRLRIDPVSLSDDARTALLATDEAGVRWWESYFACRIAADLVKEYKVNVLPVVVDKVLQDMKLRFGDNQVVDLRIPPPTHVFRPVVTMVGIQPQPKVSNSTQTVLMFGAKCTVSAGAVSPAKGDPIFTKSWGYGVNRIFSPESVDQTTPQLKALYFMAAIENGFHHHLVENLKAKPDKNWQSVVDRCSK
jgi:hypothetical protein